MTDRTDFETTLERRMRAYAATAVRPTSTTEIVRSTLAAAASPVPRAVTLKGPRRPALLVGLAAALLLGAVAGAAVIGGRPAAIQGVFVEGPSLSGGRIANAITLPDGRVLAGSQGSQETMDATGVLHCTPRCQPHLTFIDPRTGATSATAPMSPGLSAEAMALLHDGRVLLVQGSADSDDGGRAVIYDPVADRFEMVGAPVDDRTWPFLVTLADGRVLMGGGEAEASATAELFDPATGTFLPTGPMTRPRTFGVTATLLPDGRVLVIGGGAEVGTSAELFDPATGTFTPTGSTAVARGGFHTATSLPDGRVLIAGGLVPVAGDPEAIPDATASAELYDPATGTFSTVGSMATPRFMHVAAPLSDGTVLVAGGTTELRPDFEPDVTTDAAIFDPATGEFRATGSMVKPRLWPVAVVANDRVLVLGHFDATGDDPVTPASTEWFE